MLPKQFRFLFASSAVVALFLIGAAFGSRQPQQRTTIPETAPIQQQAPPRPQIPPVQEVDPPEPASGQGVNLTVRIIDGSTGRGLSGALVALTRIPSLAVDKRRWTYMRT